MNGAKELRDHRAGSSLEDRDVRHRLLWLLLIGI